MFVCPVEPEPLKNIPGAGAAVTREKNQELKPL